MNFSRATAPLQATSARVSAGLQVRLDQQHIVLGILGQENSQRMRAGRDAWRLGRGPLCRRGPAAARFLDRLQQLGFLHRFHEVRRHAQLTTPGDVPGTVLRGEHQDRRRPGHGGLPMNDLGHLEPVDAGHAAIEQYERIGRIGLICTKQLRDALRPAFRFRHRGAPAREHLPEDQPVRRVVIDDQGLHVLEIHRPGEDPERRLAADREPSREVESAAGSDAALRPYPSLHQFDDARRNGESEAGAAELARRGRIDLGIGGEDQLARLFRNPDPRVANREPQGSGGSVLGVGLDPDDHFTLLGELDRVPDEIDEDLPEPRRIAYERRRRRRGRCGARARAPSRERGWP